MDEQSVRPSKGSKHDRLTDREIRLLELLPCGGNVLKFAVSTFAREDAPCYAALSYVWAQRRTAREHMSHYPPIKVTVLLDGQPFNVNENLFHALTSVVMRLKAASADERAFERSGLGLTIRKFIWVDAICINQVDVPERNAQVASMYRTYAEATTVLVWLGREDYRSWKPGWRNNVQELADRPYWSRMWVVQEFFAARDIIIICGNHWILEQDFFQELESVEAECAAKRFADITTSARSRSEFGTQSLDHVLESYKECACSVPSDRVFALLGCIDLREQEALKLYLPNYELCYDEMVIVVLAHILRFSGKKPSIHHILLLGASIDYASKLLKIAEIFEEATRSWSSVQRLSDFEELASAKTLEIDGRAGLDDRIIYTDLENTVFRAFRQRVQDLPNKKDNPYSLLTREYLVDDDPQKCSKKLYHAVSHKSRYSYKPRKSHGSGDVDDSENSDDSDSSRESEIGYEPKNALHSESKRRQRLGGSLTKPKY